MTTIGWIQILVFFAAIIAVTKPVGVFMYRVFEEGRTPLPKVLGRFERSLYRLSGVDPAREQTWIEYTFALLAFSAVGVLITYLLQRVQQALPFNPQHFGAVEPTSAFNTATSFTTNTNWQGYSGESTMSYLSQMAALAWHNFTSAAAGICVALALARGFTRRPGPGGAKTLGNFYVDLIRGIVYVFLPLSIVFGLVLAAQGVIQNLSRVRRRDHAGGRQADHRAGPRRVAGINQAAGDQRRRLLQRQRRPPVREPDPVHELPVAVHDLRDSVGADVHLRADGARPAPRLGGVGRDVDPVLRGRGGLLPLRGQGKPGLRRPAHQPAAGEHGRQGGAVRRLGVGAVRDRHHGRLVRRRERDARQLHAARRAGAAGQHPAGRGGVRRHRRGPLRRC